MNEITYTEEFVAILIDTVLTMNTMEGSVDHRNLLENAQRAYQHRVKAREMQKKTDRYRTAVGEGPATFDTTVLLNALGNADQGYYALEQKLDQKVENLFNQIIRENARGRSQK